MKTNEIIDFLLSEFQTDKAGLATILNVHKSTISNISKGYTKKISSKLAHSITLVKPEINYEFIIGNSDQKYVSDDRKNVSRQVCLDTKGKNRITIEEITTFIVNHIEEFEKNEIFKIYKNSLVNQAKVELLQEQLLLKNSMK
ncbi:hypothetical protein [uncultured Maribacter sp.]|uniref:hypothetical protein n=1 Tax=uncultured Maribacter sp. TaxID=431308 RepID=UPI0026244603|nr:hypothetical protein [uncultured Maribacter sp.]